MRAAIEKFERLTRYPLTEYLRSYNNFLSSHYGNVINYYNGNSQTPNGESFEALNELNIKTQRLKSSISIYKNRMTSSEYWDLIDFIDDIHQSIDTINNISKWLRSSIEKNNFSPDVEVRRTLTQRQTIEDLAFETGSVDPNNDWISIALRNDIREEAYTPDGGNVLTVGYKNRRRIFINTVVDNISGINVYGLDLDKNLTFEDDDLKVLSYTDTIQQSVNVLAGLKQGAVPEFPSDGIQPDLVIGQNRNSVAYPVLTRQFYRTFRTDDTLKNLTITNIEVRQDSLFVEFSIRTRLDETVITETLL